MTQLNRTQRRQVARGKAPTVETTRKPGRPRKQSVEMTQSRQPLAIRGLGRSESDAATTGYATVDSAGVSADDSDSASGDMDSFIQEHESGMGDVPPLGYEKRRGHGAPTKAEREIANSEKLIELAGKVQSLYFGLGVILMPIDPAASQIIINDSAARAAELTAIAKQNKEFKKWLERALESSVYGLAIAGHIGTINAILAAHNVNIFSAVRGAMTPKERAQGVTAQDKATYPTMHKPPTGQDSGLPIRDVPVEDINPGFLGMPENGRG